jgi:hypothetical protein
MKRIKLHVYLFLTTVLFFSANSFGASYYVDAILGNDNRDGLSPQSAWQTLEKASKGFYQAGDQILLKGGQTFSGSLTLKSLSGQVGSPIVVSSFGGERAIISSGDSVAVLVIDSDFLVVKNLICKGSGRLEGNKTSGVNFRECKNVTIDSTDVSGYLFSGIKMEGGSDIRIANVYAHDNGYCGIHVTSEVSGRDESPDKSIRNVYIGNSITENNPGCPAINDNHSGNGILVGGVTNALIEYCESMNNGWDMPREGNGPVGIWAYKSDSVVIQYCYAHHNKTSPKGHDGGGFDFDGGVTNSIMQYNFSMYNEGAGYGMFQYAGANVWNNNIVRYNISYHDGVKSGQSGIFMWCDPSAISMKNLHAYNNTIVNKYGHGVNFLPGYYENFVFENNIFLVTDSTDEFTGGEFTGALFDKNLYWNSFNAQSGFEQPKIRLDANPIVADPLILMPTFDVLENLNPITINAIAYFRLKFESPAFKAGKVIENNGGKDYWGNKLKSKGKLNIGADGK